MHAKGRIIVFLAACVALCAALAMAACGNGGGKWLIDDMYSSVVITAPTGMIDGEEAVWSATWAPKPSYLLSATPNANELAGPFTVARNFGNGAEPNTVTESGIMGNTHSTTVAMVNLSETENAYYTVQVTVTNTDGGSTTATLTYAVAPAYIPPVITSAVYDEATQVVTVEVDADERALPVTVALSVDADAVEGGNTCTLTELPLVAQFAIDWDALSDGIISGGSGTAELTVTDALGHTNETPATVNITAPAITLAADTLYVIPLKHEAKVGETVTVVVATGVPANPFQYMLDVNVTMPDWCSYVFGSFDFGALGGEREDVDGIWGPDGMNAGSIMVDDFWEFFYGEQDTSYGSPGRHLLWLNVVPLSGHDVTDCSGILCNFKIAFSQAGTASLGFLESMPPESHTYYRDGENNDYYWGTLMAGPDGVLNVSGVDNTIVVTE